MFSTVAINSSKLKRCRFTTKEAQGAGAISLSSTISCIMVRAVSPAPSRRGLTRDVCNCASVSKPADSFLPTVSFMTASWWKMEPCTEAGPLYDAGLTTYRACDRRSQRSGAQRDWNNVPFPAEHLDKRQDA